MSRADRVTGAMVGCAAGDALGAPFEFGPAGAFRERFPVPAEAIMEPGGGWDAGEATDDTQMALLVADSLLEHDGFDGADVFVPLPGFPGRPRTAEDLSRLALGLD
ncbi:ADP-ribosylglycohydrolase family protein [Dactylosporangium sp. NPDC005555]|uniref:ADP-ribosylglycohydrolase family protein n=1 Tax=Dactylosporangium sp. NPDC005555 TaxID=3154889 RepID=UPI0033B926A0